MSEVELKFSIYFCNCVCITLFIFYNHELLVNFAYDNFYQLVNEQFLLDQIQFDVTREDLRDLGLK